MMGVAGLRHIVVDPWGNILEVTDMYDRHARDTDDPALAVSCVVHRNGDWWEADCEAAPIYTVH